ncbi:DUF3800 domain-containing protein [Limnohabitans sp. 2KL-51]|uniref:DUF3800 domain-containing protein n=1 Tax=Limnohabitans sp. 2KL-51 TaxID=1977911 RepID=UPI0011B27EAB|nr:DUF3800 domain-containing protein [Limnohabitans sp. 2KL-51]
MRVFLAEKMQYHLQTDVVVECRDKKEYAELALEFRRICDGENTGNRQLPFNVIFAEKKTNLTGLQLANLVARPIGLNDIRAKQANQAFGLPKNKFFCAAGLDHVGQGYQNIGLKIYPAQKAKSPGEPTEAAAPTGNPQST